jgi:hypothetical protein
MYTEATRRRGVRSCAIPVDTYHSGSGTCVPLLGRGSGTYVTPVPIPWRQWLRYLCDASQDWWSRGARRSWKSSVITANARRLLQLDDHVRRPLPRQSGDIDPANCDFGYRPLLSLRHDAQRGSTRLTALGHSFYGSAPLPLCAEMAEAADLRRREWACMGSLPNRPAGPTRAIQPSTIWPGPMIGTPTALMPQS